MYINTQCVSHLDPDPVRTTDPLTRPPPTIGEVVTASPSSNDGEPLMNPDTEPSRFSRHFEITGTPRGALLTFVTFTGFAVDGFVSTLSSLTPNPNNEMVDAGLADCSTCSALALDALFAAASSRFRCNSRLLCLAASAAATRLASASSFFRCTSASRASFKAWASAAFCLAASAAATRLASASSFLRCASASRASFKA